MSDPSAADPRPPMGSMVLGQAGTSTSGSTAPPPTGRFGLFGGVFVPCVLTILGVIMFMRVGFVSGYAGLWATLGILLISKAITLLTTLSLSAIATNLDVRVGGVYFMISRVLGPDFGGSIGITLFVAQAVSVAFYTIGFTEATFSTLEPIIGIERIDALMALRAPQIVSSIVVTAVFGVTFKGADVALKAQYFVLAVLVLSIASFMIGAAINFKTSEVIAQSPPAFTSEVGFWGAFAIFFPAATGITAGANMSGDLKEPARSIPWGTLLAIIVTAVIYGAQIFLVTGAVDRETLQADPFGALKSISIFAPLVVLGVFAATLSSALGSFLGAPRILQAMGQDRLMKPLVFFGKGAGPSNEPRRATVLTYVIALAVIWAGDLNAVAEIISMFFLIAYGMINLSAFVESRSANPSFRPRFRYFHWIAALAGAIGCVVAMVKINETYALVAFAIAGLLYFYLMKSGIQTSWGDAKRGYIFQRTRDNLLYLEESKFHPKNWRPILAVLSADPLAEPQVVMMGSWLESRRGLFTVAQIEQAPHVALRERLEFRENRSKALRSLLKSIGIVAFSEVVVVDRFETGMSTFLQSYSIGGLRPNLVMVGLPPTSEPERRARFRSTMSVLAEFSPSIVVHKPGEFVPDRKERTIDLWWRGGKNGSLMALVAYLISENPAWPNSKIRIFRLVNDAMDEHEARSFLGKLLSQARLDAQVNVLIARGRTARDMIVDYSKEADLVLLGLDGAALSDFDNYLAGLDPLISELPTTLLVYSNGDADVFA